MSATCPSFSILPYFYPFSLISPKRPHSHSLFTPLSLSETPPMAAMKIMITLVVLIAMTMAMVGEAKGSPAPVDCTTVVLSMSDCLSYVTNGSTVDKPEGNCCSGLKSVLKTNAECLCEGFKSSAQFGVVLNVTKAVALPDACHVHAPSAAKCGLSVAPTGAPSPAGAAVSPAGAPSGASMAPAMGPGSNIMSPAVSPSGLNGASSATSISVQLTVVGLAAIGAFFSSF